MRFVTKGRPDPPAGLSRQAAARWQEQADALFEAGRLTAARLELLSAWATAIDLRDRALAQWEESRWPIWSLRAGVPIASLAREMGHTTTEQTFKVYGGWCREMGARRSGDAVSVGDPLRRNRGWCDYWRRTRPRLTPMVGRVFEVPGLRHIEQGDTRAKP